MERQLRMVGERLRRNRRIRGAVGAQVTSVLPWPKRDASSQNFSEVEGTQFAYECVVAVFLVTLHTSHYSPHL